MTFIRKYSGDTTALIAAEYECPVHGRFEITVRRDQVPDEMPCPVEETCAGDTWGNVVMTRVNRCGLTSPWRFPFPACTRVQRVTAARRGKDPERPPNCLDWQALAYEEKSPEEWHADERKKDWEATRKIVKEALR